MIGFLRGTLVSRQPPRVTLDVGGVGYEVDVPMSTLFELPANGEQVRLLTHLVVREDAHVLYGFGTEAEREVFRSLIRVSGIGARIALAILSGMSAEGFRHCVVAQDAAPLVKIPGVGKKTAERLLIELRDRDLPRAGAPAAVSGAASSSPDSEAWHALVALGYKPTEVTRMLAGVSTAGRSTEDIIRDVLRGMNRS